MRKLTALLGLILVCSVCSAGVTTAGALASGSSPQFSFSSDASGATFTCALDNGAASACTSPKGYSNLAAGKHTVTMTGTFTVATQAPTLLGTTAVQSSSDGNTSNQAQAWSYTASASGTASSISFYVDSANTAPGLTLGLYSNSNGAPGTLLDTATVASLKAGAWNTATLGGRASITSGAKYWLAELGTGGGIVAFRDVPGGTGCSTVVSSQTNLTALPQSFSTGSTWNGYCPASFYVVGGASPSAAPSPPANTARPVVTGQDVQGQTLSTTNGSWTNSPSSYSYQWQDCNSSGANCSNISGATSSRYTLQAGDVGHTMRSMVTATNAGGSASMGAAATSAVTASSQSAPSNTGLPSISGQAVQGQTLTASTGSWANSPSSYAYQWRDCDGSGNNCTNVSGATGSTYQLAAGDVGDTMRVVVTAGNSGGSGSATSGQSPVVQSGSVGGGGGVAVVGTGAEPNVSCSSTISVGASVQSALASASPGQVVCLNAGNWSGQTITGLTPASPGVTLAAKPGAVVTMAGLTTTGTVNNLTVEGIKFTSGLHVHASGNNITVQYNTFENFADYAVEGCPACTVSSNALSNFKVVYNQIDHTAYCLRAAANSMSAWTFSHNVCGPGIGYGGNSDDHYTQTECIDGLTMDNNAFIGPFDASGLRAGVHNNVTHACGSNLEFDNNIVWHADSRAQTLLWGDDGSVSNARANNNLIVEDPTCGTTCPTVSLWAENANGASNETFNNNTIIANTGSSSGGVWTRSGITGMVSQNNIAVDNSNGNGDFSFSSCSSCSGNVANDGSGNVNWSPSWQSTSWTPTNGSPWNPPPSTYYKPVVTGGVTNTSGYQGTIGP